MFLKRGKMERPQRRARDGKKKYEKLENIRLLRRADGKSFVTEVCITEQRDELRAWKTEEVPLI